MAIDGKDSPTGEYTQALSQLLSWLRDQISKSSWIPPHLISIRAGAPERVDSIEISETLRSKFDTSLLVSLCDVRPKGHKLLIKRPPLRSLGQDFTLMNWRRLPGFVTRPEGPRWDQVNEAIRFVLLEPRTIQSPTTSQEELGDSKTMNEETGKLRDPISTFERNSRGHVIRHPNIGQMLRFGNVTPGYAVRLLPGSPELKANPQMAIWKGIMVVEDSDKTVPGMPGNWCKTDIRRIKQNNACDWNVEYIPHWTSAEYQDNILAEVEEAKRLQEAWNKNKKFAETYGMTSDQLARKVSDRPSLPHERRATDQRLFDVYTRLNQTNDRSKFKYGKDVNGNRCIPGLLNAADLRTAELVWADKLRHKVKASEEKERLDKMVYIDNSFWDD